MRDVIGCADMCGVFTPKSNIYIYIHIYIVFTNIVFFQFSIHLVGLRSEFS